jgi:hypothetical protein
MTTTCINHQHKFVDHELTDYEHVAASQTDQVLGSTGAAGDILRALLIIPQGAATVGTVRFRDGDNDRMEAYVISNTVPVWIQFGQQGIRSVDGAWKVQTMTNVEVLAVGSFT